MIAFFTTTRNICTNWALFPEPVTYFYRISSYSLNFYSFLNNENDHYKNQLLWIEKQLELAEIDGDKVQSIAQYTVRNKPCIQVLLIAHVPPGDVSTLSEYGEFYLNITKRFRDTIIGHLFGHTHTDEFKLVSWRRVSYKKPTSTLS